MRIFPPAIEIGENEGFSPEKDIFKRAEFGKGLADLVRVVEDPLVIVLDGPWGSGKTTFIKMWAGHLRQIGHPVVYFDAFANDYIDDAFIALAGEVIAQSEKEKKAKSPAHKKFLNTAARAGFEKWSKGRRQGGYSRRLGCRRYC